MITASLFHQWELIRDIVFAVFLLLIFVSDAKDMTLSSGVISTGCVVGCLFNYFLLDYSAISLLSGFVIGSGFFKLQRVVSGGRWVGEGDVYLGAMMGLWLGFPMIVVALLMSYVFGALVIVPFLIRNSKQMYSPIPFGIFLTFGTAITLIWGRQIVAWYAGFLM